MAAPVVDLAPGIDPLTGAPPAGPSIDPNAPLQRLGRAIVGAYTAPIQPVAPGTMGPLTMPGAGAGETRAVPAAEPFPIPPGPAQAPAAEPFPIPPGPARAAEPFPIPPGPAQPSMIPVTTTETTKTTQGPDAATAANINAATTDANNAATAAGQAAVDQASATAAFERTEAQGAYGRGVNSYFENLGQLQTQDEIIREVSTKLEETAKFKPDRTALFNGDTGLLFGINAAIAAMAGGWLMGQGLTGGKNPYLETVMRMIDDNANDQIQANSTVYQELTRRLGSAEAAKRELKARMYEATNATIEAQSRFNKAELVQRGGAALMAETQKEVARNRLEAAKLTGKSVSTAVQTRTQMVPNPAATGGVDVNDPKEYARVGKVSSLQNFAAEAESLIQSGEMAENVGLWDAAWLALRRPLTARTPGQARLDALRAKWELVQRQDWATEPNGQATQERLSLIAFPQNDREIPVFHRLFARRSMRPILAGAIALPRAQWATNRTQS
jgi:hypothetical protein